VLGAEARDAVNRHAIFLIQPCELQPELALGGSDGNEAASDENAKGRVPVNGHRRHQPLQLPQLIQRAGKPWHAR